MSYSQITRADDRTITVILDKDAGTVWFSSPDKVDSIEITRPFSGKTSFKQAVGKKSATININSVRRGDYYINFIIGDKKLIQKLFF